MTLKEALDAFGIALENLNLAARSDEKTPLQNALALSEVEEDFAVSEESEDVIVFADIDKFKNINTLYKQYAGDVAINEVGKLIKKEFVENFQARAFRISGDEFVLLFHQNSLSEFKSRTTLFEECPVSFFDSESAEEKTFTVKVSFGIALNDADCDFQTLRGRAELACKKAKTLLNQRFFEWTPELERNKTNDFRVTCPNCETIISCDVPQSKGEIKTLHCPICDNYVAIE